MKQRKIILNYKGKRVPLDLYVVPKSLHWLGLMFSSKKDAKPLLFEFPRESRLSIHSFFVWFSFIGIWLNKEGKVLKIERVEPFRLRILPKEKFKFLIELPIKSDYDDVLKILDENKSFK
jgi:uncharacterized membrane protein (UPF0127 family)